MSWWGKVVGGAFGFMLGGPLGALFGAAVGHHFDRGLGRLEDGGQPFGAGPDQERIQLAFFTATFAVMGHVAKADGRVSPDEIAHARAVMHEMNLNAEQTRVAQRLFREGKEPGFDLAGVLDQFLRECRRRHTLLQMFLEIQLHAAYADGALHDAEAVVLRRIANRLGFTAAQFAQIDALIRAARGHAGSAGSGRHGGGAGGRAGPGRKTMSAAEARQILGVTATAGEHEIKNAYRRLMSQHHPDKLIARGMPEEMVKVATTRTQEIRTAYETLRKTVRG
ncbi:MAG: co-chaperone DjlA [Gammaproteobacteria bacterium]